jgi:hypothetical protein
MTSRDAQLKAYREYREVSWEVEEKETKGLWYKAPANDGSVEANSRLPQTKEISA